MDAPRSPRHSIPGCLRRTSRTEPLRPASISSSQLAMITLPSRKPFAAFHPGRKGIAFPAPNGP
jgi:hypothetical protein